MVNPKLGNDADANQAKASQVTTSLMTLVNISAALPGKRKLSILAGDSGSNSSASRSKRIRRPSKSVQGQQINGSAKEDGSAPAIVHEGNGSSSTEYPTFEQAFSSTGPKSKLSESFSAPSSKESTLSWSSQSRSEGSQAESLLLPEATSTTPADACDQITCKLSKATERLQERLPSYADLVDCTINHSNRKAWRSSVASHAMNHVQSTRKRVIRNNEKLAHAAQSGADVDPEAVRDQGFTRPKVLILAPFRNGALEWCQLLEACSGCAQTEQRARFLREYKLPEGALDKLAQPEALERYPLEHIETFAGNIDDSFHVGLKLTRKSFKIFSQFYDSDFILASPLGLRLAIEKEDSADFLSSIELLVIDQSDVMLMQNWEHVRFVMSHLNKIPRESHDTDFSRVRQWYLDDKSKFFRQSIIASSFVFPELLNIYSKTLLNLSGKRLITSKAEPALRTVRTGIRQVFTRFECADPQREADLRFKAFTQKLLPNVLKSAVSASKMLIFAPSYFDFLRLEQHLRTMPDVSFAAISEYSSNKQISRAREAFFSGRKAILLMTERFHFYKRYRIRGCQTIVFYGLPENSSFYQEILEFPFVHAAGTPAGFDDLEPSEVKVEALFSRYDLVRLQRIVGADAHKMLSEDRVLWRFS